MKKVFFSILAVVMSGLMLATPVSAAKAGDPCTCSDGRSGTVPVDTSILTGCDCGGDGDSVMELLNLIVDILTIGIGILGVIGITVVGIQYLTAGGSEEKTRKAKRRMFEIVIGLVAYVLIYAALKWLMPNI